MLLLTVTLSLAGLAALYFRLRPEFPLGVTVLTLLLIFGATPLAWYALLEPAPIEIGAFALAAGLAVIAASSASRPRLVAVWIALAIVPLLTIWFTLLTGSAAHLATVRLADVLFSSWNGFLSWTPVVYIAVAGTIAYIGRDRLWGVATLVMVVFAAWLVGTSDRWAAEHTFGGRAMMPLLALLAPGLAYVMEMARRRPVVALAPLVAVALLWNHLLMVQYTVGMLPKDEPVSFARMVRQQADGYARAWRVYPFAFPANVWFAWREGLPVDRYDTLALEPRATSLDLIMEHDAGRFLLEGWDGPTAEGEAPGWWIGGRTASIALPLQLPRDRPVTLTITARSRHEEPVVEADLALMVNGHEVGQFSPSANAPSDAQFLVASGAIFREGFNRLSFVSRGTHRVDANDTRRPGPLGRRAGRPAWPVAVYRIVITPQ